MSIVQKALLHARAKNKTSINQLFTKHKTLLLGLKGLPFLLIQIHEIAYIHNELYIIMTVSYHTTFNFFCPLGFLPIPSPCNSCSEHDSFIVFATFCSVLMWRNIKYSIKQVLFLQKPDLHLSSVRTTVMRLVVDSIPRDRHCKQLMRGILLFFEVGHSVHSTYYDLSDLVFALRFLFINVPNCIDM